MRQNDVNFSRKTDRQRQIQRERQTETETERDRDREIQRGDRERDYCD